MENFVYSGNPGRVIFGRGTIERLPEEAERLKARRILVLSTPEQADEASSIARHYDVTQRSWNAHQQRRSRR